ncbi:ABC-F family ATP-binding cassette domain-containing protein [Novosphingobium sp. M1R2S20]|uniref:ABC-F family ATP-binding cassette domain-containing protein n=1 Tax=Novosphingobium rhizovicinum TaxID=3228928 RepID=A0ABV3RER0_9SPHN
MFTLYVPVPMPSFLTFSAVCAIAPDGQTLFDHLNLSIGAERVGLVGRNGSGKSTLLRIASGDLPPGAGTLARSGSSDVLAQHWPEDHSFAQALGIADAAARIARILAGDGTPEDLEAADWDLSSRVDQALQDVGLPDLALERQIGTLSGGERTRVGLARLALVRPDLLLLDEPTNNLDAAGRAAVERLIASWRGGVLLASHDRALLEHMDRIVELTPRGVHIVGGGWSAFAAQRDAERAQAAAERERSEAALRATARGVQEQREAKDRRDKAGRAFAARKSEPRILLGRQAERAENSGGQARRLGERQLQEATARLEDARTKIEVLTPLTIAPPPSGLPSGAEVLTLDAVTASVGERRLGPWTLTIRGPERVALTGPNGAGKTTLIKMASGPLIPASGTVRRSGGAVATLDQHVTLLDPADTILGNIRRLHPEMDQHGAYAACARFAFRNRDADRLVGTLSGGERLRAGLAAAMPGETAPWLLILDEPTNHLDIASVEVLENALRNYDGALLVVSHDRRFLDAIGIQREYRLTP